MYDCLDNRSLIFFFFNDTATTEIYTLSLHDALPLVKIQDGCNEFCSYCKIPFARGKSRSRKQEKILEEIDKLLAEGFREIILIGINLGDYGKDLDEGSCFESLVREILKRDLLDRLRIGSIYPDRITESFMELFDNPKMMPHLHISLQSCDDTVLKNMKIG